MRLGSALKRHTSQLAHAAAQAMRRRARCHQLLLAACALSTSRGGIAGGSLHSVRAKKKSGNAIPTSSWRVSSTAEQCMCPSAAGSARGKGGEEDFLFRTCSNPRHAPLPALRAACPRSMPVGLSSGRGTRDEKGMLRRSNPPTTPARRLSVKGSVISCSGADGKVLVKPAPAGSWEGRRHGEIHRAGAAALVQCNSPGWSSSHCCWLKGTRPGPAPPGTPPAAPGPPPRRRPSPTAGCGRAMGVQGLSMQAPASLPQKHNNAHEPKSPGQHEPLQVERAAPEAAGRGHGQQLRRRSRGAPNRGAEVAQRPHRRVDWHPDSGKGKEACQVPLVSVWRSEGSEGEK